MTTHYRSPWYFGVMIYPKVRGKGVWPRQSCAHNVWGADTWQQKAIEKSEQSIQQRKNNSRKCFNFKKTCWQTSDIDSVWNVSWTRQLDERKVVVLRSDVERRMNDDPFDVDEDFTVAHDLKIKQEVVFVDFQRRYPSK